MPRAPSTGPANSTAPVAEDPPRAGFARRFAALFGLGVLGVVGLIPMMVPAARQQLDAMPEMELSLPSLVVLSFLNPLIFLALSVAVGVALAPRVRLRSHLDERVSGGPPVLPALRTEAPVAVGLGALAGVLIVVLDLALAPWVGGGGAVPTVLTNRSLAITLSGILYGGITEELMIRWGLMSFLAWALWRSIGRRAPQPGPGILWAAILVSALAFGAGHLPAMAAIVPLTTPVITRTVALNALGGIAFGWLFWRRSLEAAMVAHATVHVVFTVASVLV